MLKRLPLRRRVRKPPSRRALPSLPQTDRRRFRLKARSPKIKRRPGRRLVLLTASNRKLFTSAAALELLGGDFAFTTRVVATARPDADGTLHGDVVLKGVGDSSLKTADLDDLARRYPDREIALSAERTRMEFYSADEERSRMERKP